MIKIIKKYYNKVKRWYLFKKRLKEIYSFLKQGNKVQAVARVQAITKSDLRNSKEYVDKMLEELKKKK